MRRRFVGRSSSRHILISSMTGRMPFPGKATINRKMTSFTTNGAMDISETIMRHMTQFLTIKTYLVRTIFHNMARAITFTAHRDLISMLDTKKETTKKQKRRNRLIKLTFKNTNTIMNIGITLQFTATGGNNRTIVTETVTNSGTGKFIRSIIHSHKHILRIIIKAVVGTRNKGRFL